MQFADFYTHPSGETVPVLVIHDRADAYRAAMVRQFHSKAVSLPHALPPISWTPPTNEGGAQAVAGCL